MHRAISGSKLRALKLNFQGENYSIKKCFPLHLRANLGTEETKNQKNSDLELQSLKAVYDILRNGEIWFFLDIPKYKNLLAVRCEGGFLFIENGNFQK